MFSGWPDAVNGLFEVIGGLLVWLNVRRLYRDKRLAGVCIAPTTLFVLWGYWNLYFYPWAGTWLSWVGGLVIVTANTAWLGQMLYYARRNQNTQETKP